MREVGAQHGFGIVKPMERIGQVISLKDEGGASGIWLEKKRVQADQQGDRAPGGHQQLCDLLRQQGPLAFAADEQGACQPQRMEFRRAQERHMQVVLGAGLDDQMPRSHAVKGLIRPQSVGESGKFCIPLEAPDQRGGGNRQY